MCVCVCSTLFWLYEQKLSFFIGSLYVVRVNTEGVGIFLMHLIPFYRTEINARYETDAVSWGSGRNRS